jgi:hypothetical protein
MGVDSSSQEFGAVRLFAGIADWGCRNSVAISTDVITRIKS